MKVKDYKNDYHGFSGTLSENTRKLAFAGIAIVWIFKQEVNGSYTIPDALKFIMLMFVVSLSFDLLQYIWQTATWGIFHRHYEKKHGEDYELTASKYLNWPAITFFWAKVIALVFGYVCLVRFLW